MDGGAANFYSHDGVEGPDCGLEGLEVPVLVRENTEMACVNPKTDTSVYVLLRGFEPRIGLGLLREYRSAKVSYEEGDEEAYLFEDVVEQGVVCIVIHLEESGESRRTVWSTGV